MSSRGSPRSLSSSLSRSNGWGKSGPQVNGHKNINSQLMQASNYPSKMVLDDLMLSQGSLRNEVLRNDETVQAVRQENVMLAEKVQHCNNLYRQLITRVSKTEERMEMESKRTTSAVAQGKDAEATLNSQLAQVQTREQKQGLRIQRLEEEVACMKVDRDSSKKNLEQLRLDLKTLHDKLARQSSGLGNGLQSLKDHLDSQNRDYSQEVNRCFNELRTMIDDEVNKRTMMQTQMEGRFETTHLQLSQNEKSRHEDVYKLTTAIREKEAIAKTDVRCCEENTKSMFQEYAKEMKAKDSKVREDIAQNVANLDRKITTESSMMEKKYQDYNENTDEKLKGLKSAVHEELQVIYDKLASSNSVEEEHAEATKRAIQNLQKDITQNDKEISRVVLAEISTRLSQREKLKHMITQIRKDTNEGLTYMRQGLDESKDRIKMSEEKLKKEFAKTMSEALDGLQVPAVYRQVVEMERKVEEIEDALDELTKQEERIELNCERIKQMEMENILSQDDIKNVMATKQQLDDFAKQNKIVYDQLNHEMNRPKTAVVNQLKATEAIAEKCESLPNNLRLMEKRLQMLSETFEDYKQEQAKKQQQQPPPRRIQTPRPPANDRNSELKEKIEGLEEVTLVLKEVLTEIVDAEHFENNEDEQLKALKARLDQLNGDDEKGDYEENADENADDEDEDDDEDDDEDEEESVLGDNEPSTKNPSRATADNSDDDSDDWSD